MTGITELMNTIKDKDTTTIDPNIAFVGTMTVVGTGAVQIGGEFEGRIVAPGGSVIVQAGGVVRGTIIAANVIISGTVTAMTDDDFIEATEHLAMTETADVQSNSIRYGDMAMTFGSSIRGNMTPLASAHAALAVRPSAAPDPTTPLHRTDTHQAIAHNVLEMHRPFVSPPAPPETISSDIDQMSRAELMTPLRTGTYDSDSALTALDA